MKLNVLYAFIFSLFSKSSLEIAVLVHTSSKTSIALSGFFPLLFQMFFHTLRYALFIRSYVSGSAAAAGCGVHRGLKQASAKKGARNFAKVTDAHIIMIARLMNHFNSLTL